ncbi:MAG: T9SS type A sorting domain-containing protein [Bacteroidota bacterium]
MMKIHTFFTTVFLLTAAVAFGQSSVNSGGDTQSNADGQHQFVVGELTLSVQGSNGFANGGVQQVVLNASDPAFPIDGSTNVLQAAVPIEIKLFPNPTKGNVRIELDHASPLQYELYNSTGSLLQNMLSESAVSMLDLSAYPAGNYFLRVTESNTKNSITIPIIKQ